jgi:magnesium-transporting ATPase (P-type)
MRAVQASNYAIGQFKCLWKLVLYHGRLNYIRIAEMILYFFYKNIIFTVPQFFFAFFCFYSGQSIFDDLYTNLTIPKLHCALQHRLHILARGHQSCVR